MKRKLCLAVLILALLAGSAWAAKVVGYEELACASNAANNIPAGTPYNLAGSSTTYAVLTAAYPDIWCTVQVADYPVAWRVGTAPTASTKKVAQVGDVFWLETLADMTGFQGIGIGGTSNLAIVFYSGAAR